MSRNNSTHPDNPEPNSGFSATELALIGSLITTVGDLITTYAAVLAVEEERQSNNDTQAIQSQLDYLYHEVQELKKQVQHDRSRRF